MRRSVAPAAPACSHDAPNVQQENNNVCSCKYYSKQLEGDLPNMQCYHTDESRTKNCPLEILLPPPSIGRDMIRSRASVSKLGEGAFGMSGRIHVVSTRRIAQNLEKRSTACTDGTKELLYVTSIFPMSTPRKLFLRLLGSHEDGNCKNCSPLRSYTFSIVDGSP